MLVSVRGLERSGTNLMTWMLRQQADIDVAVHDKHGTTPEDDADLHIVCLKHPASWCVSLYTHAWIHNWMREGVEGPLDPDEMLQSVREVVLETNALQHWVDFTGAWESAAQHRLVEFVRYEDVVRRITSVSNRLCGLTGHAIALSMPSNAMLMNSRPGTKAFDQEWYLDEEWRAVLDADMVAEINKYAETFYRFGYKAV